MKKPSQYLNRLIIASAAAGAFAFVVGNASDAEASHFSSIISQARAYGRTYGNWSTRWWKWLRGIPTAQTPSDPQNPVLEGDPINFVPVDCSRGQSGPVWFLPGTTGGVAKRSCTIPRRKALFFPLVNAIFTNARSTTACGGDADCPADNACVAGFCQEDFSVEDKRQALLPFFDGTCEPIAELDGRPLVFDNVAAVRVQSAPFRSVAGSNDVLGGMDGEVDPEAISDGVWALLPPMSRGMHELRFGAAVCFGGQQVFSNEAVYQINVQ